MFRSISIGHFGVAVPNYKKTMERFKDLGCTIIPCKSKLYIPSFERTLIYSKFTKSQENV